MNWHAYWDLPEFAVCGCDISMDCGYDLRSWALPLLVRKLLGSHGVHSYLVEILCLNFHIEIVLPDQSGESLGKV